LAPLDTDLTPCIRKVAPVAHQTANFGKLPPRIRGGHPVMRRQVDQLDTPASEEWVDVDQKGIGPLAHKSCESDIDLAAGWSRSASGCCATWYRPHQRSIRSKVVPSTSTG
jgi:hypothetical protein